MKMKILHLHLYQAHMISEISFLESLIVALIRSIFSAAVSSMGGGGTKSSCAEKIINHCIVTPIININIIRIKDKGKLDGV